MTDNDFSLLNPNIVKISNEDILQNEISLGRWIVSAIPFLFTLGESYDLQKRIKIDQLGFSLIPDIYLEKGCKAIQLNGRTIIEIKSNLLLDTEIKQSEIYKYLIDGKLVDNLFVVYINASDDELAEDNPPEGFRLIKAEAFVNQIKQAIKDGKGKINKALRKEYEEKASWHYIRESRLLSAISDYNRYNSVLFLGAGVSVSANIPDWNSLLMGLLSDDDLICKNDYEAVYKEMDYSNLMVARYIQDIAKLEKKTIVDNVRNLLYSKSTNGSELINAICGMVEGQEKVRSVITYNYDTLIEDNLRKRNKRCFPVYKNIHDEGNSFPVYHVHGIVYRNGTNERPEDIVLSEQDYHKVYSEVFDWSNVEQLHALTRCTCFFIGLSMKDPNLRRLLEIAKRGSGKALRHYVFLERKSFSEEKKKSEIDFQTRENMFADLGINVIWYEGNNNHEELPKLLHRFKNADHDKSPK